MIKNLNDSPPESNLRDNFYKDAINYLLDWYSLSKASQLAIMEYLTKNIEDLASKNLELAISYQLESSKILYSTVALLDKMIRIQDNEKKI